MPYGEFWLYETAAADPILAGAEILAAGMEKQEDGRLKFTDGERPYFLPGGKMTETRDGFTWEVKGGPTWSFKIVTLKRFEEHWRSRVYGAPPLQTDEDLWQYYSIRFGHGAW